MPAAARPKKAKKPNGRPPGSIKADLDIKELEKLAALHCTYEEAAAWLGVTKRTFITYMEREEVRDAWERGQGRGRVSLRRIQYQLAEKGNAPMAIFLGKNLLGQRDRFDTEEEGDPTKDAARRIKGALDAIESAVVDTDKDEE